MKIKEFIIMPQTIKPMGLIHKPGVGPNNRFGFKNSGNNKANEDEHSPDLKLPTGEKMILQADDDEHTRGLVVTSNKDGSYDTYYWYQDPNEAMPIEIKIDGESVSKDAKNVKWEYHPELDEARGSCWHGYQQKGYKKKGNRMVPNCVKEEFVSENKIKLSTDPNNFGAIGVEKYQPTGPVVNIPVKQLVGFEPEDKMRDPKSMAKVNAIAKAVQDKKSISPILARKHKNGYQVIDGHHRFWGQSKAGVNYIKAQIVPPEDIEEAAGVGIVTKQNATKDVPVGGEYMNVKKLGLGKGKPKTLEEEFAEFLENIDPKVWTELRAKGLVRPMEYDSPEVRAAYKAQGKPYKPEISIITKDNMDHFRTKEPERLKQLKPIRVSDQQWIDYMDNWWRTERFKPEGRNKVQQIKNAYKLLYKKDMVENFADGKRKGKSRPGRVKRAGASCKGSVTSLRAKAKKSSGERAKMYHWCANMKSGRKKKK